MYFQDPLVPLQIRVVDELFAKNQLSIFKNIDKQTAFTFKTYKRATITLVAYGGRPDQNPGPLAFAIHFVLFKACS